MIPLLLLASSCLPVDGPKLLARHLAVAFREFGAIAPDTDFGYAPAPGAVRTFRGDELTRLGAKHGVTINAVDDICVAWNMAPLDPARAADAMREALPQGARLDVLEVSGGAVPPGALEFPYSMLKSGLWRGYVRYGPNGRFYVWARVRVTSPQTRVIATAALKPGVPITGDQLRMETVDAEPSQETFVGRIEDAVGMVPRRTIFEGAGLSTGMLDHPTAVGRGDTVRLTAISGATRVAVEAQAQSAGKVGDVIAVKNPSSGRVLRARVEKPGEVTLTQ